MDGAIHKIAKFRVVGMDCADEVAMLRTALAPLPGVRDIKFDVLNARITVAYDENHVQRSDIEAAVARTGMRAHPVLDTQTRRESGLTLWQRWGRTTTTTISGLLVLAGFVAHGMVADWYLAVGGHETAIPLLPCILYLGAVLSGAWFILPKTWHALRSARPDMNLLMTIAVAGAIGIGEYFEAATVTFLFALSLALESWSVGRARRAITALLQLTPPTAWILDADGREQETQVDVVTVGARIVVRPGERIPLDGRVVAGQSQVNQAPITGESVPVEKVAGSEVFAGSINGDGALEFESTKPAADTTLVHIIRLVEQSRQERAPAEQWVERFARYYTPMVMALAALLILVPPLVVGGSWPAWFYRGLVLLVIACPCALVISTPVSIVAALTAAARHGVLVKGGLHLEQAGHIRVVALDKTGTLTEGRPRVRTVVPLAGHTECEIVETAGAIEARSEHPLGRAIVRHAEALGLRPAPVGRFAAVKGKGATGVLDGRPVWIGSRRLLEERGQETPEMHAQLEQLSGAGTSVVVVGCEDHVCGFIAVEDRVRPESAATVAALKAVGVERVVMLTGDNRPTAERIGSLTGVDEVRAELLPEAKVAAVEELVQRYGAVAMIGDGVNDAPALARANLGIAMGAIGSDAAIETADIALMSDDLGRIPWLIRHSRRMLTIIRQNIASSLAVKGLFAVLTLLGHASLWAAIAADMGVSLLVVLNALRLLNGRESESPFGLVNKPKPQSHNSKGETMNRLLFAMPILCITFLAAGCAAVAEWPASGDEETWAAVASKAEDIGQLIGPSGFGGPQFAGYSQHMGAMMGFLGPNTLADPNGTIGVQLWNQSVEPCTFHLTYLASYDQLQEQAQDITVEPGQVVTFDMPCAEIVGLGSLTQVGAPAGSLGPGVQLGNQFCVPGFLNSDYLCGGTFACFLSPDANDLDGDNDTQELVITTQPLQQHIGPGGMMGHGHMMGGWR